MNSLWGEEFSIPEEKEKVKKVTKKINSPKVASDKQVTKKVSNKKLSIEDRLKIIYSEVDRILGKYKENTICIRDKETLKNYFDKAIENDIIAIDTETDNSLDPLTCKLMGPCIYTPGMKNAYIPMHHTDLNGNLLDNQLTEEDFKEQLDRIDNVKTIFHNSKFDYKVIKCTCSCDLNIYWDTMIAHKLLDENSQAGLKYLYINLIDASQEKYDIEHLFEGVEYAKVDPEVFALYAATDPYMTYKLYEYQINEFNKIENKDIYDLLLNIELPIIKVVANMELRGICVDTEYANKISIIYHKKLDSIQEKIDKELLNLKPIIDSWRLTKEANEKPKANNAKGFGKSKNEKLSDPIELSSSTQMAILLYDILKVPVIDEDNPRGTGKEIIEKLEDSIYICKLLNEKRGVDILLNTFIDKIPQLVKESTGRLHANFNTYGAATGRFSSNEPNLQNIPSHVKDIRLIFRAKKDEEIINFDSIIELYDYQEIETSNGFVLSKNLSLGDTILSIDNELLNIKDIFYKDNKVIIQV